MSGVQAAGQAESPSRMTFLARGRVEDLHDPEPADAAHHRIDDALRKRTGEDGVERVAAGGEQAKSCLDRLRLRRDDHRLVRGRRRFGFGIAASVKLAGEGFGRAVDTRGACLEFLWHLQNTVGGMSTDDIVGDSEVALGDRAMPNLMAALSRPHKSTAGVFQKSNEPPIESRDHSARDHRHLVRGEVDRYRLAAFG